MNVSGVVHFYELSAPALTHLREFQRLFPEIEIVFSGDLSHVSAHWESFDSMSRLTRIAATIEILKTSQTDDRSLEPCPE